ncbi:unnamed protein product [Paramecium primaurelia]|uniref:Uncharacterized protein n=1 Tax=Paramecium primaurelia TaxID=5886 RepID=A0A8S1PW29_PARPR|nr:unnamed protein product [Paramecium primaurelia]
MIIKVLLFYLRDIKKSFQRDVKKFYFINYPVSPKSRQYQQIFCKSTMKPLRKSLRMQNFQQCQQQTQNCNMPELQNIRKNFTQLDQSCFKTSKISNHFSYFKGYIENYWLFCILLDSSANSIENFIGKWNKFQQSDFYKCLWISQTIIAANPNQISPSHQYNKKKMLPFCQNVLQFGCINRKYPDHIFKYLNDILDEICLEQSFMVLLRILDFEKLIKTRLCQMASYSNFLKLIFFKI